MSNSLDETLTQRGPDQIYCTKDPYNLKIYFIEYKAHHRMMCDAHGRVNAAHQQEVGMCAARPPRRLSGDFSLTTLSFSHFKRKCESKC